MKVLNYGSLNIDYTYDVPHFVRDGETMASDSLYVFSGGKGLNQSLALAKSGAAVYHAGAVGESDGDFLLDQLKAAGVHTELVSHTQGQTGHAIIQRNPEGGNCILLYGGANQKITKTMVDQVLENFEAGDYLILQNEISQIGYIMEKAREKGMTIVMNPSPMDEKIHTYPLLYVDLFLMNEVEAADLCGSREKTGEKLLSQVIKKFPNARIVLTLGSKGSLYWDKDQVYRQGIYHVDAVDTTAAGDTFTGFFIGGLIKGKEAKEALDFAAKAAAIAVSRPGAAPSIPTEEEVMNRFIRNAGTVSGN